MNSRNYSFDLARSICVIWIVGFWHILNYFPPESKLNGTSLSVSYGITTSVLACFTFLSGYFLKKYDFNCWRDIKGFYIKRLIRFYPLFASAVIMSVICGTSIKQGLFALIGLSMFSSPPIGTLWYFSMLLFFYVLTPVLKLRTGESFIKTIWPSLIIFIIIVLVVLIGGNFVADRRLVLYFPFYVIGLNLPNQIVENGLSVYSLIGSVVCFFFLTLLNNDLLIFSIAKAFMGMMAILSLSKILYNNRIQRPVSFISYASMCAYLFHRPLYAGMLHVISLFNYNFFTIPIALLALITVFLAAFYIQKTYDWIINRLINI